MLEQGLMLAGAVPAKENVGGQGRGGDKVLGGVVGTGCVRL